MYSIVVNKCGHILSPFDPLRLPSTGSSRIAKSKRFILSTIALTRCSYIPHSTCDRTVVPSLTRSATPGGLTSASSQLY